MTARPDDASVADDVATLVRDGIVLRTGLLDVAWVDAMAEDVEREFHAARGRDGGAVPRGPQRWYVEIHPEQLRGFADLAAHPWFVHVCEQVLGPEYEIVEVGFDVPYPGAAAQPWHRDFPSTPDTYVERRLTSLAFNVSAVDTVPEMGPVEVALGTQWEPGTDWDDQMFPPASESDRYAAGAVPFIALKGDVTARSALTVHRGTANRSRSPRPVLVLGVDAPGAGHAAKHDLCATPGFLDSLPDVVRRHLACRVVDRIEPIVQKHQIAQLVERYGDAP